MEHVFFTCHQICLQEVFLQYFFKCSILIEHPCAQVGLPLDYTEGYDPELAQCDVRFFLWHFLAIQIMPVV